jgi:hypothetical protein
MMNGGSAECWSLSADEVVKQRRIVTRRCRCGCGVAPEGGEVGADLEGVGGEVTIAEGLAVVTPWDGRFWWRRVDGVPLEVRARAMVGRFRRRGGGGGFRARGRGGILVVLALRVKVECGMLNDEC